MAISGFRIQSFDFNNASDKEYAVMHELSSRRRAERLPEEPPIPLDEQITDWRNIPPFVDVNAWTVLLEDSDTAIASGDIGCANMEDNKHVAHFGIYVLPEYRQKGLATELLSRIADVAKEASRTLLLAGTNGRVPAGEAFMTRLGASKGLEGHTNQLDIEKDLNANLLQEWIERAQERAGDFELVWFDAAFPEELLEEIVAVGNVIHNTMPRGELELEDTQHTVEHLRQWEKSMAASGGSRWSLYVRDKRDGKLAGFTEVYYHPNRPYVMHQGGTGVLPEHRGLGLGRWLKAAVLQRMIEERPEVKFVRTGNADRNAPMLSINHALGFKPFISDAAWQIPTEKVFAYLAEKCEEK